MHTTEQIQSGGIEHAKRFDKTFIKSFSEIPHGDAARKRQAGKELEKEEIIRLAAEKKLFLESSAIEFLSKREDWKEILEEFEKEPAMIVKEENIRNKLLQKDSKMQSLQHTVIIEKKNFKPYAEEIESDLKINFEKNCAEKSVSGKVGNFLEMFQEKYNFLNHCLKQRLQFDPRPLSMLEKAPRGKQFETIAMIRDKRLSKNGHLMFTIEDLETEAIAIAIKDDKIFPIARQLLLDEVIGIKGIRTNSELFIIKEILWPELPNQLQKTSQREVSAALLSDLHVGSKLFMEKEFQKFLSWINANNVPEKEKKIIEKIKYIIIAGDNVDGIGIYPQQYDELQIKDIYEQYKKFSELILQIPDYIEVIIAPGQHDAVRSADPQPSIPKEFAQELHEAKNIHLLSSPGWMEIEGLKTLVYHGASLHDLFESISGLDHNKPWEGVKELLKRRHLMPGYGIKRPYVPEKTDYLLIKENPDLYFGGDFHLKGYAQYKSCTIMHASAWQEQTSFMKQLGIIPTKGILSIINLKDREIAERYFFEKPTEVY